MSILEEIMNEYQTAKKLSKLHQFTTEIEKRSMILRESEDTPTLILFVMRKFKSEQMGFFDELQKEYDQMLTRIQYVLIGMVSILSF
jgi:hypothetical protein